MTKAISSITTILFFLCADTFAVGAEKNLSWYSKSFSGQNFKILPKKLKVSSPEKADILIVPLSDRLLNIQKTLYLNHNFSASSKGKEFFILYDYRAGNNCNLKVHNPIAHSIMKKHRKIIVELTLLTKVNKEFYQISHMKIKDNNKCASFPCLVKSAVKNLDPSNDIFIEAEKFIEDIVGYAAGIDMGRNKFSEQNRVESLGYALQSSNTADRIRAIYFLSKIKSKSALQKAIDSFQDNNEDNRYFTLVVLDRMRDEKEVKDLLLTALKDKVPKIRKLAASIAGVLTSDNDVLKALQNLATDKSPYVRAEVIRCLASMKYFHEVDLVIKAIKSKHPVVRKSGVEAIGIMKNKEGVLPLIELLKKEGNNDIRNMIVWSLIEIRDELVIDHSFNLLKNENASLYEISDILKGYIEEIKKSETHLKQIGSLLHKGENEAAFAIQFINIMNTPAALPYLIDSLEKTGKKESNNLYNYANNPISNKYYDSVIKAFASSINSNNIGKLGTLLKHKSYDRKSFAIEVLGHVEDKKAVKLLLQLCKNKDDWVSLCAVESLVKLLNKGFQKKKIFNALTNQLKSKNNIRVELVLEELASINVIPKDEYFYEYLVSQLKNKHGDIAFNAAVLLAKAKPHNVSEPLLKLSIQLMRNNKKDSYYLEDLFFNVLFKIKSQEAVKQVIEFIAEGFIHPISDEYLWLDKFHSFLLINIEYIDTGIIEKVLKSKDIFMVVAGLRILSDMKYKEDRINIIYNAIDHLLSVYENISDEGYGVKTSILENEVMRALAKVGDKKALGKIISIIKKDKENRHTLSNKAVCAFEGISINHIKDKKALVEFIKYLLDLKYIPLSSVMKRLILKLDNKELKKIVYPLLNKNNVYKRLFALEVLAARGDKNVLQQLSKLLKTGNVKVRMKALELIAGYKNNCPIQPLVDAVEDEQFNVQLLAIQLLGEINNNTSASVLLEFTKDRNELKRMYANEALMKITVKNEQTAKQLQGY